jgi:hypothetical protein
MKTQLLSFNIRFGKAKSENNLQTRKFTRKTGRFETVIQRDRVAPPNIGPRVLSASPVGLNQHDYNEIINGACHYRIHYERVFCGTTEDPFSC